MTPRRAPAPYARKPKAAKVPRVRLNDVNTNFFSFCKISFRIVFTINLLFIGWKSCTATKTPR